jgi:hypothetical protein
MSTDMASTDPTPAGSGEQWSRTMDLVDEIKRKLIQLDGICTAVRLARGAHADHATIHGSLWDAIDLIEDARKAVDELQDIYLEHTPKEAQS